VGRSIFRAPSHFGKGECEDEPHPILTSNKPYRPATGTGQSLRNRALTYTCVWSQPAMCIFPCSPARIWP